MKHLAKLREKLSNDEDVSVDEHELRDDLISLTRDAKTYSIADLFHELCAWGSLCVIVCKESRDGAQDRTESEIIPASYAPVVTRRKQKIIFIVQCVLRSALAVLVDGHGFANVHDATEDAIASYERSVLSRFVGDVEYESSTASLESVYARWFATIEPRSSTRDHATTIAATAILISYAGAEMEALVGRIITEGAVFFGEQLARVELGAKMRRACENTTGEDFDASSTMAWTVSKFAAPVPDDLYQFANEYLLHSRWVPCIWGRGISQSEISRSGCTFRRNPASGVLARACPEGAQNIRRKAQNIVETASCGNVSEEDWELGFAAMHHACAQSSGLNWLARFVIDGDTRPAHALRRAETFKCRAKSYAPAIVHVDGAWYLLDPHTGNARKVQNGWHALRVWTAIVRVDMRGVPCRSHNVLDVVRDVASREAYPDTI